MRARLYSVATPRVWLTFNADKVLCPLTYSAVSYRAQADRVRLSDYKRLVVITCRGIPAPYLPAVMEYITNWVGYPC